MSAVARWREVEGRMPFVRGRLPAGVPAVLGSVFAAATVVWPVLRLSQSTGMNGVDSPDFTQLLWSWGRYEVEGIDVSQDPPTNVVPAWSLALACLAGVLGGLAWLVRRGPDGRVLGAAGVGVALAVVGGYSLERIGNVALYGTPETTGLTIETLPVGRVEYAASVLLLVAFALMLWRPVVGLARSIWAFGERLVARGRRHAAEDEEAELAASGQPPRVGKAVLRDLDSSRDEQRGMRAGHGTPGVGFTDGSGHDDRFARPT